MYNASFAFSNMYAQVLGYEVHRVPMVSMGVQETAELIHQIASEKRERLAEEEVQRLYLRDEKLQELYKKDQDYEY
jgi:hypothetical protein